MNRLLAMLFGVLLIGAGVLLCGIFVFLVLLGDDRVQVAEESAPLAGFGGASALAGLILLIGALANVYGGLRLPFYWLGLLAFGTLISAGFVLNVSGVVPIASPFLAVLAAASLAVFFAGLLLRWAPYRRQSERSTSLPFGWGMTGAVLGAFVLQLMFAAAIVTGIYLGLASAGVDPPNAETIRELLEDFEEGSTSFPDIFYTSTVLLAATSLFVLIAPLTEELTKFLGAFLSLHRSGSLSQYSFFLAGAMAGLGFATTENIGYALIAASAWPETMLLRAPVVLVHMAASSIVAIGWYRQLRSGGLSLVWFFALAVLLHGSFNAVVIAAAFIAGAIGDDAAENTGAALAVLLLFGIAATIIMASLAWLVLNARRFGKIDTEHQPWDERHPRSWGTNRGEIDLSTLSGRALGSTLN